MTVEKDVNNLKYSVLYLTKRISMLDLQIESLKEINKYWIEKIFNLEKAIEDLKIKTTDLEDKSNDLETIIDEQLNES